MHHGLAPGTSIVVNLTVLHSGSTYLLCDCEELVLDICGAVRMCNIRVCVGVHARPMGLKRA